MQVESRVRPVGFDEEAVVLDIGISFTKVGYAGEFLPRQVFPTPVKLREMPQDASKYDYLPVIQDFLRYVFFQKVQSKPKEGPVIVTEKFTASRAFMEAVAEILYRDLQVPVVCFVWDLSLPVYITGGYTAMVIDVGYGSTQILPVINRSDL